MEGRYCTFVFVIPLLALSILLLPIEIILKQFVGDHWIMCRVFSNLLLLTSQCTIFCLLTGSMKRHHNIEYMTVRCKLYLKFFIQFAALLLILVSDMYNFTVTVNATI